MTTAYLVQGFTLKGSKLVADVVRPCKTEESAIATAERLGPIRAGRCLLARQLFINRLPQRLDALGFAGQRGPLINLLRDAQRVSGIELAVEIGIQQ